MYLMCVCVGHDLDFIFPGVVSAGKLAAQRHLRGRCRGQRGSGPQHPAMSSWIKWFLYIYIDMIQCG